MSARKTDVLVIGGGIHGCSAALHLALAGVSVVVLEKDHVARHASGVNAGGVRRLGRDPREVPLAQAGYEAWQDLQELVQDDCGYIKSRYLKVARTEAEMEKARTRVAELNALGFTHEEVIGQNKLREFLPAASEDCIGAIYVDDDGHANPFRTTQAIAAAARRAGAYIHEETGVTGLERAGAHWRAETAKGAFEAPTIINAAGAWGAELAALVGDDLPLEAHGPMLAVTEKLPKFVEGVIGCLGAPLSLKQSTNGSVIIGGGVRGKAVPETNETHLDMAGLGSFVATAGEIFPRLKTVRVVRSWAGIEGYTPDNLPIIGPGSLPGVIHVFGFSAHGFMLGPIAGQQVAALAQGKAPAVDMTPFSPDRFHM